MKQNMSVLAALAVVISTMIFQGCGGCSSSSDAEDIASALADRLTSDMQFEDGRLHEGEPPEGSESDELPQIVTLDSPLKIHLEQAFRITLETDFTPSDDVTSAVLYVVGASSYIVINVVLSPSGKYYSAILPGEVVDDNMLRGETFKVQIALQRIDGRTGGYKQTSLTIADSTEPECESGNCCNGGEFVEDGGRCFEDVDNLHCTRDTCNADHVCESRLLGDFCTIDGRCYETGDDNPGNYCLLCDAATSTDDWTAKQDGTACDSGEGEDSGECIQGECVAKGPSPEDLMLDSMNFSDRAVEEGDPPEGVDDATAPQIVQLRAPSELRPGADFHVILFSDFTEPERVNLAIVQVEGASGFASLEGQMVQTEEFAVMDLGGLFIDTEPLKGKRFVIGFALQTEDGLTGRYKTQEVVVPYDAPECSYGACCNGGVFSENGLSCNDENACTYDDQCNGMGGCVGVAISCTNDAGLCGVRRECNGTSTCSETFPTEDVTCDDADACTYTDHCDGAGACKGTTIECVDDFGTCGVKRSCNGTEACEETTPGNQVACDDQEPCTFDDHCDGAGACTGTTITCTDDPGECSVKRQCNGTDTCNEAYPGPETDCDDSDACTYNDRCNASGRCVGASITCTDEPGVCGLKRSCNGTDNCDEIFPGNETTCDDADPCTYSDMCDAAGGCSGTAITCTDDFGTCALNRACDGSDTCQETYPGSEASCDDGNDCTYDDSCDGLGSCGGTTISCVNEVTTCGARRQCNGTDSCTETFPELGSPCDDQDLCTSSDKCDGQGNCSGDSVDCGVNAACETTTGNCICDPDSLDCDTIAPGCETPRDAVNCPDCGVPCTETSPANAYNSCENATCKFACNAGYIDCNGDLDLGASGDGCEGMELEICDGIDNNCDGSTDEDFEIGEPCVGRGVCGAGTWMCNNLYTRRCSSEPTPGTAGDETQCDGLDNDCDGFTDEGFMLGEACELPGVCGQGEWRCCTLSDGYCASGDRVCSSISSADTTGDACDFVDNDCDGQIDEGPYTDASTGGNVTVPNPRDRSCSTDYDCYMVSTMSIYWECDSLWEVKCPSGSIHQTYEICNDTYDNECDSLTDETPCLSGGCTGVGYCGSLGASTYVRDPNAPMRSICQTQLEPRQYAQQRLLKSVINMPDSMNPVTTPMETAFAPYVEICDNIDNDCDGETDELFPEKGTPCPAECGSGVWVCNPAKGILVCNSYQTDVCDGKDNDCDGLTDGHDLDNDGIGAACDNCPDAFNPNQDNSDADDFGDLCDNCPFVTNPDQTDSNQNRIGDACE